jgi:hypothetical protein
MASAFLTESATEQHEHDCNFATSPVRGLLCRTVRAGPSKLQQCQVRVLQFLTATTF